MAIFLFYDQCLKCVWHICDTGDVNIMGPLGDFVRVLVCCKGMTLAL